ncbi:hypothetical protein O2N63_12445 [Aliiroseovarius sp. KMU-50]|uniref:DUF1217 domain-containing protein n=1 Tax=Aliiroseovarius salicola TaxID=3009082 RepID=A0ABT4W320_9RHOB|nr:hypothetical protein [Aliiroseovarius sp. KMU-50]MDA5094895.1 hypothetical protein [Aliiroseovarius sp. KMU-50]
MEDDKKTSVFVKRLVLGFALTCTGMVNGALAETGDKDTAASESSQTLKPMSAIDWLSNSVALPAPAPATPLETGVTDTAAVEDVTVSPIGTAKADAVGLLPASVTGLPIDLWGNSRPDDLARRILSLPVELMPAMQKLLIRLMLAELNPPKGTANGSDRLFLARVDRLLGIGALDQADALLARSEMQTAASFRRAFDTSLLLGEEDITCQRLSDAPELSPTFQARIFCLARKGDWDAAVLALGTGRALGYVSEDEDAILSRFLDPDLFEGEPAPPAPQQPSPLTFRLYEAIGEHISTSSLPLAFAQADLRANIGWKARAEAGERLSGVGAISDNQIFGLYTERKPAASGGIWDRMAAVRALDNALKNRDADTLSVLLPEVWSRLEEAGVELPFSRIFGPELASYNLSGEAALVALHMGLLSDHSEEIALRAGASDARAHPRRAILLALAKGDTSMVTPVDAETEAVLEGFAVTGTPIRLQMLVEQDRLGEAILRAIALFSGGALGDLDELTDALAFFRQIGLEQVARQAAIEFLILDRRG